MAEANGITPDPQNGTRNLDNLPKFRHMSGGAHFA